MFQNDMQSCHEGSHCPEEMVDTPIGTSKYGSRDKENIIESYLGDVRSESKEKSWRKLQVCWILKYDKELSRRRNLVEKEDFSKFQS